MSHVEWLNNAIITYGCNKIKRHTWTCLTAHSLLYLVQDVLWCGVYTASWEKISSMNLSMSTIIFITYSNGLNCRVKIQVIVNCNYPSGQSYWICLFRPRDWKNITFSDPALLTVKVTNHIPLESLKKNVINSFPAFCRRWRLWTQGSPSCSPSSLTWKAASKPFATMQAGPTRSTARVCT